MLPEGAKINGFEREDVAFGLVARRRRSSSLTIGGTEAVEEAFANVDDVESVSIESTGRL